jgi:hypothetical protein
MVAFWNPEFDNSPVFPQYKNGSLLNNDLATWNAQCENDTEIYSIYLRDTEREANSSVFDTKAGGQLANQSNTWELMAWGYDTEDVGFIFLYEDAPTTGGLANICFEVREWGHPTKETREALIQSLVAFNVPELKLLAEQMKPLRHDQRRAGSPRFSCDEACQNNNGTVEAWARTAKEAIECPRE